MVKITKVYTRTGDKGTTQLAAGKRVPKTALRIEVLGCLDELNSFLGWAITALSVDKEFTDLHKKCLRIQNELFDLGAQIAVLPENVRENTPKIKPDDVDRLEQEIDAINEKLPILNSFVLPGGNEISARLHITRAVCRRAERALSALAEEEALNASEIPYLNRLSDWFFVTARSVSSQLDKNENLWRPGERT